METGNQREGYGPQPRKVEQKEGERKTEGTAEGTSGSFESGKGNSGKTGRKERRQKNCRSSRGTVLTAAVAAGAVYVGMGQKYKRVYFPNTTINGLDVSGLTPDEVKKQITDETSGYTMILRSGARKTKPSGAQT